MVLRTNFSCQKWSPWTGFGCQKWSFLANSGPSRTKFSNQNWSGGPFLAVKSVLLYLLYHKTVQGMSSLKTSSFFTSSLNWSSSLVPRLLPCMHAAEPYMMYHGFLGCIYAWDLYPECSYIKGFWDTYNYTQGTNPFHPRNPWYSWLVPWYNSQCFTHSWGSISNSHSKDRLVIPATIHPRVCMERWKAVPGCMADRYCGGTFYLPTHYGANIFVPWL